VIGMNAQDPTPILVDFLFGCGAVLLFCFCFVFASSYGSFDTRRSCLVTRGLSQPWSVLPEHLQQDHCGVLRLAAGVVGALSHVIHACTLLSVHVHQDCDGFKPPLSLTCRQDIQQAQDEVNAVNIYDIYRACFALAHFFFVDGPAFHTPLTSTTACPPSPEPCINAGFHPQYEAHYTNPLNSRGRRRPLTEFEQILFGADKMGVAGPVECIDAGAASVYVLHLRQVLRVP